MLPMCVYSWTVACQASLSMEFSRQEYWSGLPFPPPRDLFNPGDEPTSSASSALAGRFFTAEPPGKPKMLKHPKIQKIYIKHNEYTHIESL